MHAAPTGARRAGLYDPPGKAGVRHAPCKGSPLYKKPPVRYPYTMCRGDGRGLCDVPVSYVS